MSLVLTLASRNLFQDRLRFTATLIGIVFSVVLVMVQMGLYLGFGRMVTAMIDHASAALWIVASGTKSFEDPSVLDTRIRNRVLAINGVADVAPVVIGFADWRLPGGGGGGGGGMTPVFVVGSDLKAGGLLPWNVVEGSVQALTAPGTVAIDRSYYHRLGVSGIGSTAEIRGQPVRVAAVTDGIRSFTTTPYVFCDIEHARSYIGLPARKTSHFLVWLKPGAEIDRVRQDIRATIPGVEALTPGQFRSRSRSFWLFGTGAGAALFGGALLGVIVGTVIVAQTLYSSTKDHLYEFATLRAIGCSNRYIYKVIAGQALHQCHHRILHRGGDRNCRRQTHRGKRIASRNHANFVDWPLPPHRRHVHSLSGRRHPSRRSHRSCDGDGTMTAPIIEAKNVTKVLGSGPAQVRALKSVNLSLTGGRLTMLMGPSGSGKTTLLSILGCLLTPTEGTVRICGVSTDGAGPEGLAEIRRRHVGFVFQSYHLFPTLTAAENVRLALDVRGERGFIAKAKSQEVLASVGLAHKSAAFPRELSGGEQQRVAIARAIVAEPSAILADEPTAALDSANGQAIVAILSAIAKERDRAVLVVTHDARLTGFADTIIYIDDGLLRGEEFAEVQPLSDAQQRLVAARFEPTVEHRS